MGDHESSFSPEANQADGTAGTGEEQGFGDLFFGASKHTLDSKGRFILPSRFRAAAIKQQEDREIVFLRLPRSKEFIQLLHPVQIRGEMFAVVQAFNGLPESLDEIKDPIQKTGTLVPVNVGKNGRVTIPKPLRENAQIDRELYAIGVGKMAILISPVFEDRLPDSIQAAIRASAPD